MKYFIPILIFFLLSSCGVQKIRNSNDFITKRENINISANEDDNLNFQIEIEYKSNNNGEMESCNCSYFLINKSDQNFTNHIDIYFEFKTKDGKIFEVSPSYFSELESGRTSTIQTTGVYPGEGRKCTSVSIREIKKRR